MSQQSLSQGMSSQQGIFSQFSQNSQEEALTNEVVVDILVIVLCLLSFEHVNVLMGLFFRLRCPCAYGAVLLIEMSGCLIKDVEVYATYMRRSVDECYLAAFN